MGTRAGLPRRLSAQVPLVVLTVATWNVLHRVHAENWDEPVRRHWPSEADRIAAITARVRDRPEQVIALQEVSGDQLASLRAALPERTVHALRYPRWPTARRGPSQLTDPSEHLVLLVHGPSRKVAAEAFASDAGKGALAVQLDELLVVATHVRGDDRRKDQLARLAELADRPSVLLGDFNTDPDTVVSVLGHEFTVATPPQDALPTRPGRQSLRIDHVVVRGVSAGEVAVISSGGLSDHNLVRATIGVSARR